jgi:hypothetical protein
MSIHSISKHRAAAWGERLDAEYCARVYFGRDCGGEICGTTELLLALATHYFGRNRRRRL